MMTKVTHTNQCPSHHIRQARPCPPYVALLRAIHSINLGYPSPVFGLVCTIIRFTEKYYRRAFRFVPASSCLSPLLSGWPNLVGGVWVPTGDERPREWRLENGEPPCFLGRRRLEVQEMLVIRHPGMYRTRFLFGMDTTDTDGPYK